MEESLKNRVILILAILTAIFFISTVGSCTRANHNKAAFDKEMRLRLDFEEKLNKFLQEKTALENKANTATQGLEKEKAAHQATKDDLKQEELVNESLQDELLKVNKLKEALEKNLKEALAANKAAKQKK